jgi:hypothetical protein
VWGGVGRCGEVWGGVGRCGEVWGGVGRCVEVWGGVWRWGVGVQSQESQLRASGMYVICHTGTPKFWHRRIFYLDTVEYPEKSSHFQIFL